MNERGEGNLEKAAAEVAASLQAEGHDALFAGGCVRDRMLGLEPDDYDIATSASPEEVLKVFPRAIGVGEFFGVMLVHSRSWPIQVATFRTEGPYSDHRRPDHVSAATLEEDAARRDFTINGMYWDPTSSRLIDLHGGEADLRNKVIRAIGDPEDRLREDHLRMLRAVRFASRLGFDIDNDTQSVVRSQASRLEGISRERIGEEVRRMLLDRNRSSAASLLSNLGLNEVVLGRSFETKSYRYLESLPNELPREDYGIVLAAWSLDLGGDEVSEVWREKLMLSNADRDSMVQVLDIVSQIQALWQGLSVARQKRLAAKSHFQASVSMVSVLAPGLAEEVSETFDHLSQSELAPEPLIGGKDLIQAGYKAGPGFTRVIDGVYDAQLEGRVVTMKEAMEMASRLWSEL
ncbi:MAG: hypothetical protein P8J89_00155 [Phycisphaerales bacterium]|nr:hypothetical protein [Phycisphaerales bacterium]